MPNATATLVIDTFYWLPYCSTCVKAEQHLLAKGAKINTYVNLKEEPVSRDVVLQLCELIGGPDKLARWNAIGAPGPNCKSMLT